MIQIAKTMKTNSITSFLICICGIVLFNGCDPTYSLTVKNNADYPLMILPEEFDNLDAVLNPQHSKHPGSSYQVAFPNESVNMNSWNRWDDEASRHDGGCIKVFIMDTLLPHRDTFCIYYMQDWSLRASNCEIAFPPTQEMRNFLMWPPYGTYDANGHRIE